MYDYQTFIDCINIALQSAISQLNETLIPQHQLEQETGACFFKIVGDKLRFYFTKEFSAMNWSVAFSGNLYRLIGSGFPLAHCVDAIHTESREDLRGFYFL